LRGYGSSKPPRKQILKQLLAVAFLIKKKGPRHLEA
jgi:hypothetical protein